MPAVYRTRLAFAVELGDGKVTSQRQVTFVLDCRDEGDEALCDEDDDDGAGGNAGSGGEGDGGTDSGSDAGGSMPGGGRVGDKVDLLFMVDNSSTMGGVQETLRAHVPQLLQALLAGVDLDGDGALDYEGARDVHLGVVSSDLGLPGIETIAGCSGLGDDGRLVNTPSADVPGCSAQVFDPPFLTYVEGESDFEQVATDFACLSSVGTHGCSFEQQLESTLRAVWPGDDDQFSFVSDPSSGIESVGNAGPGFPNGDFVRNDPTDPSVIAIVIVSDEEDCSSRLLDHLEPSASTNGMNTRCYFESLEPDSNLFEVERYVSAFKALRPGNEQLVLFGAIVGVPPELVAPAKVAAVDYADATSVDAFYGDILADEMMQYEINDNGTPDPLDDNLRASCMVMSGGSGGAPTAAYPARRIVDVARGFGPNGFVQSICNADLGPAIELLVTRIAAAVDSSTQ